MLIKTDIQLTNRDMGKERVGRAFLPDLGKGKNIVGFKKDIVSMLKPRIFFFCSRQKGMPDLR